MGAIDRAEIVNAHDFFNSRKRPVDKWFAHADTGIIDQNIDPAVIGEDLAIMPWTCSGSPTSPPIITERGLARRTC